MSLHFSSGRVLLKNITDNQWYYMDVRIGEDLLPHLHPEQEVAGDYSLSDYDEYAIIRADDGELYKIELYTDGDGTITFKFQLAPLPVEKLPIRLFLKDSTTGIMYVLTGGVNELTGIVYPELNVATPVGTGNRTLDRVFPCKSPISVVEEVCKSPASVYALGTVIVSPRAPLPGGGILLGAGGEGILGGGNSENIEGAGEH